MKTKPISSMPIKKPSEMFVPGESKVHIVHVCGGKSLWSTLLGIKSK